MWIHDTEDVWCKATIVKCSGVSAMVVQHSRTGEVSQYPGVGNLWCIINKNATTSILCQVFQSQSCFDFSPSFFENY